MSFEDDSMWRRPEARLQPPATSPEEGPTLSPTTDAATPGARAEEALSQGDSATGARKLGLRHHGLALLFALVGGGLGIAGAFANEIQAGVFAFLAAGVIEEAIKPAGIYILLAKWPEVLRGRLYTAGLTAVSGLVFGLIEAAAYIYVYFPDASPGFVTYRLTLPLVMHSLGSFIFGLGIKREVIDWANGVARFPRDSRNFFVAAMILHGGYNLAAVVLRVAGVVDFE